MQCYFSRHGDYRSSTMGLNESGREALVRVRAKLVGLGFRPEVCWTSEAKRTIESAETLFPGVHITRRDLFENYGNLKFHEARVSAKIILKKFMPRKNTCFVIHSVFPAVLGLQFAERQGAVVDWPNLPSQITELDYGCGIFVEGARFEYISPAS